jgi:hypothetical protein
MGAAAPLIVAALSAGAQAYQTNQVAKDQDAAAAQGIRSQAANQRQADEAVGASVDQLGQSTPEGARAKATEDFLGQLRRNRGQAIPGATSGGSARYNADMAGAQSDVADFGSRAADTLARINAPAMQREAEGVGFNRLSSNLGMIGRNASGDQFLDQLRLRSVRPNPWVSAGAELGQGAASGMAQNSQPSTPRVGRPVPRVDAPRGLPANPYDPRNA